MKTKTKTPKQISAQLLRVTHAIAVKHWDGKQYRHHAQMMDKIERLSRQAWQWIDRIYLANGMSRRDSEANAAESNRIWDNAATPRTIYAGY